MVAEINELIIEKAKVSDADDSDGPAQGEGSDDAAHTDGRESEQEPPNFGSVLMEASCTPADIRYPTDLSLLSEAREKSEAIIDALHRPDVGKTVKPRTSRLKARKN